MGVGPAPVRFAGQTNLIVWDEAHRIEHFVRDARFETAGSSLGFVAPSPTKPEIEAASPDAFSRLERLDPMRTKSYSSGGMGGGGLGGGVSVVERKNVAGYEATVLQATDTRSLGAWMKANGYPLPPYAERWTAPYIRAGWYLTAFKVIAGGGQGATGPVRMSFRTDTPFNPYSVPAENGATGGLKLYYVSAGAETPKIGRVRPWLRPAWKTWMDASTAQALAADLKLSSSAIPADATVSLYRDPGFGRPGQDDLYFVAAPKRIGRQAMVTCLGLGVFAFVRTGRRRA